MSGEKNKCGCGGEFAEATVHLTITSSEDIQFFSENKVVVMVCKQCKHVSWKIGDNHAN